MESEEIQELTDQARNLSCQTVRHASCSNLSDELRIRSAIAGFEDEVDTAIHVLMLAGAYTPTLRRAYDQGEDIRGAGIQNLTFKLIGGSLWLCCAIDACTRFDHHGIARRPMSQDWTLLTVVSALLASGLMPIWVKTSNHGPDWARGTLNSWYLCGTLALGTPYLVASVQGKDEVETLSIVQCLCCKLRDKLYDAVAKENEFVF